VTLALRCTEGALRGQLIEVGSELVLGRALPGVCGLGGDAHLSPRHARLWVRDGRLVLEDLGSANGTWVNGELVTAPRALAAGDEVRCGQTRLEVCSAGEAAADARAAADAPASGAPHLAVVGGPLAGQTIPLGAQLAIGRRAGGPGALGGDARLSSRHARVARGPGGLYYLQDTGSTSGTTLNGEQLRAAHPVVDGDRITVGSSELVARGLPRAPAIAHDVDIDSHADEHVASAGRGYAPQGAAHTRLGTRRLVAVFAAVFAVSVLVGVAAIVLAAPPTTRTCPDGFVCQRPLTAPALLSQRTFRGALGWRTEYDPAHLSAATADVAANTLLLHESARQDARWGLSGGDHVIGVEVRGYDARQMTAADAMSAMGSELSRDLVGATAAPSSDQMFDRPVLGLHPAVGEVLEGNAQTPQGPGALVKVAALGATSGRVTVAVGVIYVVQKSSEQQNNPDKPLDLLGDQVLETVRFPSDGAA
jgi:pSer/pThr/pTyr-binding forkhead associated (FHA) protein